MLINNNELLNTNEILYVSVNTVVYVFNITNRKRSKIIADAKITIQ